jgi:hypothetical protein
MNPTSIQKARQNAHVLHVPRVRYLRFAILITGLAAGVVSGETIDLTAVKDNTLYEYDPANTELSLNSNGQGNFFSAGRTLSRGQLRRGLLQFDFASLPDQARVTPGSLQLDLYVVDVPRRDPSARPLWLVPAMEDWGEGTSATEVGVSGAGSGAAATAGDATWFHTSFDPSMHDDQTFTAGGAGYWSAQGAIGDLPIDPIAMFGAPLVEVPSEAGPVTIRGASLEQNVNDWLAGQENFGWLLLGDETVAGENESSARGFASHEHVNELFRPKLRFEYFVPEPGACGLLVYVLLAAGSALRAEKAEG